MGKVVFCRKNRYAQLKYLRQNLILQLNFLNWDICRILKTRISFPIFISFSVLRLRFLRKPRVGIRCKFLLTKKKIDCCSIWKISSSSAHKILGILTHYRRIIKLVDLPNRKIKSFGFIYTPSHLDEISTQIEIESI